MSDLTLLKRHRVLNPALCSQDHQIQPKDARGVDWCDALPRQRFLYKFRKLGLIDYNDDIELNGAHFIMYAQGRSLVA